MTYLTYILLYGVLIRSLWVMLITFNSTSDPRLYTIPLVYDFLANAFKVPLKIRGKVDPWVQFFILFGTPSISMSAIIILSDLIPLNLLQGLITLVSSILVVLIYDRSLNKIENIFFDLDLAIEHSDKAEIINWLNKYKNVPFFIKIALKKYGETYFNDVYKSLELYKGLQKEMPIKVEPKKRNKI